jgi:prephenate dehydratase
VPTILPHMDAAEIPSPASVGTISFLGPAGTFTEEALFTQDDYASAQHVPAASLAEALEAVSSGRATLAFVPIENSIEGAVNTTVDSLVFEVDLLIQREVVLDVHLHLAAQPGTTLEAITRVLSIPVASAQCRRYLADQLPNAEVVATNSTAEAARVVGEEPQRGSAALATKLAAEIYDLEIIARGRGGPSGQSDPVRGLVAPSGRSGSPRATTRRASCASSAADRPGSLHGISASSRRATST